MFVTAGTNTTVVLVAVGGTGDGRGSAAPPTGDGGTSGTRLGSPGPEPAPAATGATAGAGSRAGSVPGQAARPLEGCQTVHVRTLSLGVGARPVGGPHHGQQGQGPQHKGHVPVPAVRAAHLVVVQSRLLLGGLESVLDGPAAAGHGHQRLQVAVPRGEGHVGLPVVPAFVLAPRAGTDAVPLPVCMHRLHLVHAPEVAADPQLLVAGHHQHMVLPEPTTAITVRSRAHRPWCYARADGLPKTSFPFGFLGPSRRG